jgi:hypothetical protein
VGMVFQRPKPFPSDVDLRQCCVRAATERGQEQTASWTDAVERS